MLPDPRDIIAEVRSAPNLDGAFWTLFDRIKRCISVDAIAIYLRGPKLDQYVLRASDTATPESRGQVRSGLQAGLVGLVGERQELTILANAPAHPRYAPAVETGEQPFETFLGVPLIHYHQVHGVLVAWKQLNSPFHENEVSFLVTIAVQMAHLIQDASNVEDFARALGNEEGDTAFVQGVHAAPGVAIGTATLLDPMSNLDLVPDRRIEATDAHETAFLAAIDAVQADLRVSKSRLADRLRANAQELFDAYILLLGNDSLVTETLTRIRGGNWAPGAWRHTISEHAHKFDQMEDPYFRSRAEDVRNLGGLVLQKLHATPRGSRTYPDRCILVADTISIQDIATVPADRIAGIVSRYGSAFSHTALLAKALGIPAVVSLGPLPLSLVDGATMVIDGDHARIHANPSPAMLHDAKRRVDEQLALAAQLSDYGDLPTQTIDGVLLPLHSNVGLDLDSHLSANSAGVGLCRTEYQFLLSDGFPVEAEQYQTYRQLLESYGSRPVNIRTLDIGGDKPLPYFPLDEDNPSLGVRGIRFSLAHPEIFMIQLRALLRANAGLGNLQVLFPMVARISELEQALELLARAHRELLDEGQLCARPKVGVMIEVPSAVFQTKALASRVDFVSLGTNDLAQYVLAADRMNARVATPDDAYHPAVLNAMNMVIQDSHAQETPVSACGEMAGDPAGALLLLGMGIDNLSMSPANLMRVHAAIRSVTVSQARSLASQALCQDDENQVRVLLSELALQAAHREPLRAVSID